MKVKVENFQSIKQAELEIKGLTVVTGENSIGKSALARALAGAFSNLRGTSHVRNGEKYSSVEVRFDDGNTLVWEKGSNRNKYIVNGTELEKVGSEVPQEVRELGVQAIELDGREVWPQVARQFQTIFLLDLPPSVLSSALSDVEVIQKIELASQKARSDVRDLSSRLKYKNEDLFSCQKQIAAFEGFDISALRDIEALENGISEIDDRITELEGLQARRRAESAKIDTLSDTPTAPFPEVSLKKYEKIGELEKTLSKKNKLYLLCTLLAVADDEIEIPLITTIPKPTEKLERASLKRSELLQVVEAITPLQENPALPSLPEDISVLPSLEKLLSQRKKCLQIIKEVQCVRELPDVGDVADMSSAVDLANKRLKTIWGLGLAEKEVESYTKQIDDLKVTGVCPLCQRGACGDDDSHA